MPDYGYTTDDNKVRPIRLSTKMATAMGFATGGFTDDEQVSASESKQKFGLWPRRVLAKTPNVAGPDEKTRYKAFICPTTGDYESRSIGGTITYNELTWTIYNKEPEVKAK